MGVDLVLELGEFVAQSLVDPDGAHRRYAGRMLADRVLGSPHPAVRELLAARYSGVVRRGGGRLVVPAEPTVSVVFTLSGEAFVSGPGGPYRGGGEPRSWATMTLTPVGAFRVIGTHAAGQVVHLRDLLGTAGRELAEAMTEASSWRRRFRLMDTFLLARAEHRRVAPEVERTWQRLLATRGRVPIRQVAAEVGWSHQYLVRRCREQLGQPPKTLARMLRFRATMGRVLAEGRWEQAVFDAGYYDQSHFCREVREFTGATLTQYLANALPCGCLGEIRPRRTPAATLASGA